MHKLSRIAFLAFSLLLAMTAHATAPALTSLSLTQGSAGGGTTLHIYGTDFGTPGTSAVNVLVGGEYCQNTLLVAVGDIQCQMPVGVPGNSVYVAVYVDGVVSSNTLPFDYLQRPQLQSPKVLTGYSNNGAPMWDNYVQGSAAGGDTLLIGSSNFGFLGYAPWEGQPRDLKVFVGGNECLNPVLHWNDVLAGVFAMGNTITCTTPAGTPGDYGAEIKLFINGVQDTQSAQCNGCGYPFDYLPRPQLQQVHVVMGYNNNGAPILSPSGEGSAGGGDTLVLQDYSYDSFQAYAPFEGQPRDLKVTVGGNECLNPVLHWNDGFSPGTTITCITPTGTPGNNAEIKLFINGVQDQQSAQCNGCGYPFDYLPRPQLQQVSVVTGYYNYGAPILSPSSEGSAGGGDTLVLQSFSSSFGDYTLWGEGQPRDLKVTVGGSECLNPVLHWNDAFGQGTTITCITPAGTPSSNVEVKLFINGVQDQQSAQCGGCGYVFEYFSRPQLQQVDVVTGYDNGGIPLMSLSAMGSASGGDTLLIRSPDFFGYAPYLAQPRNLQVSVGGRECLNPVLHWDDAFGETFGGGLSITCTTPVGTPSNPGEIELFINGVQDDASVQCNGCGLPFQYLPRPQLQQVDVVAGYDNGGIPLVSPSAMGSASGGDTLLIRSPDFFGYAPYLAQPRDLQVSVGGKECLNPVLHWDDAFGAAFGGGLSITCTTPAGTPGNNAEIKLFIDGVQDQQSAQCNGCGHFFQYLPRPEVVVGTVTGYGNGGLPIWDTARGSAAGGDTLALWDYSLGLQPYAPVGGQPRNLKVYVDGKECLNPLLHWDDAFGQGSVITCTTPAGTPGNNAEIKLFIDGVQDQQSAQCNGCGDVFEYWSRPNINEVDRLVLSPDTGTEIHDVLLEGSPVGGTRLQIMLSHEFHPGITPNWQVMIGAAPCANVQYDAGNQSITCFTPAGSAGSTVPVRVWQDGMPAIENDPAVFSFQYRGLPQISQLTPAHGFSGGGSVLSIQGNFFADAFSQIAVRVGNKLCDNAQLIDPSTIECTVPRGVANTTVPVTVSVDGANTPTPNALPFTYDAAPQLTSLTPDHGPLSGGNLLEIEGAYFGNFVDGMPLSVPMVLVGNKLCSNPVFTDETHLVCIVPSSTTATTVNVSVFVDGIAAGNKLPYTYAAPAFSNMTPAEGLPTGGYPIVISGSDLGVPGQTSVAVKIGTKYCSSPVLVSDTAISCTMPAGTGSNLPVTVYLNGQAKITGLTFSYVTPVPVLQSVTPAQGLASGGTLITLSGSHFNTSGASVNVGNSACTVQSQTEQEIVCSTTAGNAGMQPLTVTVNGNTSNALLFEYTGAMPLNGIFRGSSVQENTGAQ